MVSFSPVSSVFCVSTYYVLFNIHLALSSRRHSYWYNNCLKRIVIYFIWWDLQITPNDIIVRCIIIYCYYYSVGIDLVCVCVPPAGAPDTRTTCRAWMCVWRTTAMDWTGRRGVADIYTAAVRFCETAADFSRVWGPLSIIYYISLRNAAAAGWFVGRNSGRLCFLFSCRWSIAFTLVHSITNTYMYSLKKSEKSVWEYTKRYNNYIVLSLRWLECTYTS